MDGIFAARKSLSRLISLAQTPAKPPHIMEGAFFSAFRLFLK